MRRKTSNLCIFLGAALVLGALLLFLHNQQEAYLAREASRAHLEQLVNLIDPTEEYVPQETAGEEEGHVPQETAGEEDDRVPQETVGEEDDYVPQETAGENGDSLGDYFVPEIPEELLTAKDLEMKEVAVDGHSYIGYLALPTLNLELPILANWDYTRLQIAPCRYHGTLRGNDLVLMAHNYAAHFGKISNLRQGDPVIFVDVDGRATRYEVVAQDILDPYAVEEMIAGEFDLTLFTCTYGGKSRVTMYCNRAS